MSSPHDESVDGAEILLGDTSSLSVYSRKVLSLLSHDVLHSVEDDSDVQHNRRRLFPGDVCTIIEGCRKSGAHSHAVIVYVNRFWRTTDSVRSNAILWFQVSKSVAKGDQDTTLLSVTAPIGVPKLISREVIVSTEPECKTTGTLPCGTKFYVYRMLLYCDDFNPRSLMFPKGSVGGFYMLPIGMSMKSRRSCTSLREISLTPNGVSTNFVFDFLIDDFLQGATQGFQAVDHNGRRCVVFTEVVGFVADYPASSAVLDTKSHSAHAPCTHCSFRVLEGPRSVASSRYAHSVSVHSGTTSFSRGFLKTKALRKSEIDKADCDLLGMNEGSYQSLETPGLWPLIKLSERMSSAASRDATARGCPVPYSMFDAYSRTVVAPDHLITGLATNLIECCFDQVRSVHDVKRLDLYLRSGMRDVGFEGQLSLFNVKTKRLYSMSMSAKYCLLLILPYALQSTGNKDIVCYHLTELLHQISALVFWWPAVSTDGREAFSLVHGEDQSMYHATILGLVKEYIMEIDILCTKRPCLKPFLDKPNVHRLLELAVHTIPVYSHALLVAEMMFESGHQLFKHSLSKSTNPSAHLYASRLNLARDWLSRIAVLYDIAFDEKDERNEDAMIGLVRLFGGPHALHINWHLDGTKTVMDEFKQLIRHILQGTTENKLMEWYQDRGEGNESEFAWSGAHLAKSADEKKSSFQNIFCADLVDLIGNSVMVYDKLLFNKCHNTKRMGYKHHDIREGDCVEVFIDESCSSVRMLHPSTDGTGLRYRLCIHALAGTDSSNVWAAATRFKLVDSSTNLYYLEKLSLDKFVIHLIPSRSIPTNRSMFTSYF